jgi:hypothetical protein
VPQKNKILHSATSDKISRQYCGDRDKPAANTMQKKSINPKPGKAKIEVLSENNRRKGKN